MPPILPGPAQKRGDTIIGTLQGIEKRVHAHALRHSYAVELEREGATLSTIRDLLGHSSASITDRYLRRLGTGEAVDFARRRTWDGI